MDQQASIWRAHSVRRRQAVLYRTEFAEEGWRIHPTADINEAVADRHSDRAPCAAIIQRLQPQNRRLRKQKNGRSPCSTRNATRALVSERDQDPTVLREFASTLKASGYRGGCATRHHCVDTPKLSAMLSHTARNSVFPEFGACRPAAGWMSQLMDAAARWPVPLDQGAIC